MLLTGQSNTIGGATATDTTWGGAAVQAGATVRINGSTIANYPSVVGPIPYLVQEMLDGGVTNPVLVVRGESGVDIEDINTVKIPGALADKTALAIPGWDAIILWHGETDSIVEADALAYDDAGALDLKLPRFVTHCHGYWPGSPIYTMELLTVDTTPFAYHATVRAAQLTVIAASTGVELIATRTPSVLPTYDDVHATPNAGGGYAQAAERMWAAVTP